MRSPSLQPVSVLFKSVTVGDLDCLPSSVHDKEGATIVDGLCSFQFPLLSFTATETLMHFLPERPTV